MNQSKGGVRKACSKTQKGIRKVVQTQRMMECVMFHSSQAWLFLFEAKATNSAPIYENGITIFSLFKDGMVCIISQSCMYNGDTVGTMWGANAD